MLNRLRRRLGRTGLLLAAALHLLGGALLASAHAEPGPAAAGAVAMAVALDARGTGGGEPSPEPHHAQHCAACQAIGTSALPVERASASPLDTPAAPAADAVPGVAPTPYAYRAPPGRPRPPPERGAEPSALRPSLPRASRRHAAVMRAGRFSNGAAPP